MANKKTKVDIQPQKKYTWGPGRAASFRNVSPDAVGRELERLEKKYGNKLEPHHVVTEARNSHSPLHRAFEWDTNKSAEQYWLLTARNLLRSVEVTIITPEKEERVVKAFVSTLKSEGANRRQYSSTEYAMNDPELRGEVLKVALRELAAVRRKYAELSELAVIFSAIDKALKAA